MGFLDAEADDLRVGAVLPPLKGGEARGSGSDDEDEDEDEED